MLYWDPAFPFFVFKREYSFTACNEIATDKKENELPYRRGQAATKSLDKSAKLNCVASHEDDGIRETV